MKFTSICYLTIALALNTHTLVAGNTDNNEVSSRISKTVYVVLNNDASMQEAIKNSFEQNWTLSEIEFLSISEYKEFKSANDNLYIMLTNNEGVDGNNFVYENTMQVFYLVRSGAYRVNITGVPLNMQDASGLSNGVRMLQDKLSFQIAKEQQEMEYADYNAVANSRISIIKTKSLYIASEDLDKVLADLKAIEELYSGEVFIVSHQQLDAIIAQKSDAVAYVAVANFKSGMTYLNSKQVIDAESGMVLYTDESKGMKASGFSKDDFIAIQK